MRVLVEDLPDLDEIAHSEGLSFKNKGVGVENNKIEGPVAPQNAPNVEIVKVFIPGAYFMSIPVTQEIVAAEDEEIDHHMFNILGKANGRAVDPTKHPPDGATTHSQKSMQFSNWDEYLCFGAI
jgi:hypothetical protein